MSWLARCDRSHTIAARCVRVKPFGGLVNGRRQWRPVAGRPSPERAPAPSLPERCHANNRSRSTKERVRPVEARGRPAGLKGPRGDRPPSGGLDRGLAPESANVSRVVLAFATGADFGSPFDPPPWSQTTARARHWVVAPRPRTGPGPATRLSIGGRQRGFFMSFGEAAGGPGRSIDGTGKAQGRGRSK